jgi:acetyl esterase/lipase
VTPQREAYGDGPRQYGEWWVPQGEPRATVVLVHGGFWRSSYDCSLEHELAADLTARGYLCWNVEYAAADQPWPATLTDVAAAYDHAIADERVAAAVVVGHSAGGQLALWLASRHRLAPDAPGAVGSRHRRPDLCVAQAPVAALVTAARERVGRGAVEALVGGGPDQLPERYAVADPMALLPTGVRTVVVHGTHDDAVPLSLSQSYVSAAGDDATLRTYVGGHFEHLDPMSEACDLLRAELGQL